MRGGNVQPSASTLHRPHGERVVQHHTQTAFNANAQERPGSTAVPQQQVYSQNLQFTPTAETVLNLSPQEQFEHLEPEQQKQLLKEMEEKRAIIEKHNQFVEKQYEKALKKARSDHLDWLKEQQEQKRKLYQKLYRPTGNYKQRYSQSVPRYIFPEEIPLFQLSVQKYYDEHPTTTTTTTTTPAPPTKPAETSEEDADSFEYPQSNRQATFLPTSAPAKSKPIQSLEDLDHLQQQYKSHKIKKDELLAQLKQAIGETVEENKGKNLTSREIQLSNGQRAKLIKTSNPALIPQGETEELVLANGQKVQVVKTTNPDVLTRTSSSALSTEDITLPDGTKAQLIKTTNPDLLSGGSNVKTEEITLPDGRKAELIKTTDPSLFTGNPSFKTEEITLPDGRKAELIKTTDPKLVSGATKIEPGSNLEKLVFERTTTTSKPPTEIFEELTKDIVPPGANFELLKHDSKGGLEQVEGLPSNLPNQKKVTFVLLEEQSDGSFKVQGVKGNGGKDKSEVDVDSILKRIRNGEIKLPPTKQLEQEEEDDRKHQVQSSTEEPKDSEKTANILDSVTVSSNAYAESDTPILKTNIGTNFVATTTSFPPTLSSFFQSTTASPRANPVPNDLAREASSSSTSNRNAIFPGNPAFPSTYRPKPTVSSTTPSYVSEVSVVQSVSPTLHTTTTTEAPTTPQPKELLEVLRSHGLYAAAKFLRQSGLDTILNETGPYTIFAPTDKAFKTLLVQLGGPEKAEEKFKENPRLLSGVRVVLLRWGGLLWWGVSAAAAPRDSRCVHDRVASRRNDRSFVGRNAAASQSVQHARCGVERRQGNGWFVVGAAS